VKRLLLALVVLILLFLFFGEYVSEDWHLLSGWVVGLLNGVILFVRVGSLSGKNKSSKRTLL